MRVMFRYLLVCFFFLLAACDGAKKEILFVTVDGNAVDSGFLKDKALVINYWADWCKPCVEEIPELNHFYAKHGDKLFLVGFNYDGLEQEPLLEQAKSMGIEFPLIRNDLAARFGYPQVEVLPTTVFVSLDTGKVQTLKGPQTLESLENTLGEFL